MPTTALLALAHAAHRRRACLLSCYVGQFKQMEKALEYQALRFFMINMYVIIYILCYIYNVYILYIRLHSYTHYIIHNAELS